MANKKAIIHAEPNLKVWFKGIAEELERLEAMMPFKVLPEAQPSPEWVTKVEKEVSISILPAAKLREANFEITPKRMGALLGHMCAMAVWMREFLEDQIEKVDPTKISSVSENEVQSGLKTFNAFLKWYKGVRRFAKKNSLLLRG